jgi:hypothetical protein
MKRFYNCFFIVFFLLFFMSSSLMAQPGNPVDPGCDPDDPYCPIDNGLTALLLIGAGYGAIKYMVLNKKSNQQANDL